MSPCTIGTARLRSRDFCLSVSLVEKLFSYGDTECSSALDVVLHIVSAVLGLCGFSLVYR